MTEICGRTIGPPLAEYDREQRCWKTSESTCLWGLPLLSLTLPTWGMTRAGELYERQTPEHHTRDLDYSLLLPTPVVNDMGAGKTQDYWETWAPAQKSSTGKPAPHGRSLFQELLAASTDQRLPDGRRSSAEIIQNQSQMDGAIQLSLSG